MFWFYLFIFPNDKKYCGITDNLDRRMRQYKSGNESHRLVGYKINQYGWNNLQIQVADGYGSWEELCQVEKQEIQRHNTFYLNHQGYNKTLGGDGNLGHKHTGETKNKMSKARKGKPSPNKGKKHTPEQNKAKSERQKGKPPNNKGKGIQIHGTYTSYNKYRCRCDECKKANSDYYKTRRKQ